ncbi:unnamed protein product [Ixodes hexagonus]
MNTSVALVLLVGLVYTAASNGGQAPLVQTRLGPVVGTRLSERGSIVNAYLGIPFAVPPVGERRFLKPVPAEPWKGTLHATSQNKGCVQTDMPITPKVSFDMSETKEDCLYLNVWVPERACDDDKNKAKDSCDKLLPVFVFIYGGFFGWGSTSLFVYDGVHFAARSKLIVVTFNYRLNVFGFLNASSPVAPGNMGLYDQVEALRWIRDNIRAFGGDPDSVTVAGQSAGAISASYHMMSDLSKGLFKRAALLSGAPSTIAYSYFVDQLENIRSISHVFNCTDFTKTWKSQITDAVSCLRRVESQTLANKLLKELTFRYLTVLPAYGDNFLPNSPIDNENIELNIKEVFMGTTSNEGDLLMIMFRGRSGLGSEDMDAQTMMLVSLKLLFNMSFSKGRTFAAEYLTEKDNVTTLRELSRAIGDAGFECPADLFASVAAERNLSVYRYLYDYRSSVSFWDDWVGATHNDDLPFFLGGVHTTVQALNNKQNKKVLPLIKDFPTEEEYEFSDELIDALAEFCRSG